MEIARQAGLQLDVTRQLNLPYAHVWLAQRAAEGEVLGFAIAHRLADEFELIDIVTLPGARRQGVGSALIQRLVEVGCDLDLCAMYLEVRSRNLPAIRLYEKHGFTKTHTRPNYYQAPSDDALCMRRPLALRLSPRGELRKLGH